MWAANISKKAEIKQGYLLYAYGIKTLFQTKTHTMKKFLGVLFIAATLVACNGGTDADNKADSTKDAIDSSADVRKDAIDSSADVKKDAVDSAANKMDTSKNKK